MLLKDRKGAYLIHELHARPILLQVLRVQLLLLSHHLDVLLELLLIHLLLILPQLDLLV